MHHLRDYVVKLNQVNAFEIVFINVITRAYVRPVATSKPDHIKNIYENLGKFIQFAVHPVRFNEFLLVRFNVFGRPELIQPLPSQFTHRILDL